MSHKTFLWPRRVTYADCTVGNHVYYSRYLDFLEEARGEFFRSLGIPMHRLAEDGFIFPVTEARLKYRGAARYDDELEMSVWLTTLSMVRLEFASDIRLKSGDLLVSARTAHVCTDTSDKPRRMNPQWVSLLAPYLQAAPPTAVASSN